MSINERANGSFNTVKNSSIAGRVTVSAASQEIFNANEVSYNVVVIGAGETNSVGDSSSHTLFIAPSPMSDPNLTQILELANVPVGSTYRIFATIYYEATFSIKLNGNNLGSFISRTLLDGTSFHYSPAVADGKFTITSPQNDGCKLDITLIKVHGTAWIVTGRVLQISGSEQEEGIFDNVLY